MYEKTNNSRKNYEEIKCMMIRKKYLSRIGINNKYNSKKSKKIKGKIHHPKK